MSQVYCGSCGTANESGAAFCGSCGNALAAQQAAGQTAASYQPQGGYGNPPTSAGYQPYGYVSPEAAAALAVGVQVPAGMIPAGFGIRLGAYLIDAVILAIVGWVMGNPSSYVSVAVAAAYCIGFWALRGQTPGKMVLGLQVVPTDGKPLDAKKALVRYAGYMVSAFILGIGFFMIGFDGAKRGLHDRIAGTTVVRKVG